MFCNKCNKRGCSGYCSSSNSTRNITINNSSIGRDGESAYEIAVRNGYEGTEEEFTNLMLNNGYNTDNWT